MKALLLLLLLAAPLLAAPLDGKIVIGGGSVSDLASKQVWGGGATPGPAYEAYMVPTQRVVSEGTTTPGTDRDRTIETTTSATVANEAYVYLDATLEQTAILTNETPEIATLDGVQLTRVSDGTASVLVSDGSGWARRLTAPISQVGGQAVTIDTGWTAGSFAKNVIDWFESAVAGKTATSTTMSLPTSGGKNTNLWTGSLDLSCLVLGNSRTAWPQGALIADRVVCYASHVGMQAGDVLTFRRHDTGALVTRTVNAVAHLGDDLSLARLDSAPGTGVTPAKLLPADMSAYWQIQYGNSLRPGVPVLKVKRIGGLRVGIGITQWRGATPTSIGVSGPRPAELADWYVEWVGGDSGSVIGTVTTGAFVFLGNAWTGPGSGDDGASYIHSKYTQLDAQLSTWGQSVTYATIDGTVY